MVEQRPDVVQRFVDATIIGWYHYLDGDPAAAHALIKRDNPDISDEQLAYSRDTMKSAGIVISGAAETKGIGCMTDAQYRDFFDKMVAIGVVDSTLDYQGAYTTRFVCKGVGMNGSSN